MVKMVKQLDEPKTPKASGSPHVFVLDDGNFAISGEDITLLLEPSLQEAYRSSNEVVVRIPRRVLLSAKEKIPDK
jgi:hypothetical protein